MYNAGILLYTIKNNNIYFLLGKDSKWRQWSDFGGKNDDIDNTKEDTAVREFYEESMGVIYDFIQVKEKILKCDFIKTLSFKNHDYFMYIMKVDYNDEYIQKFKTMIHFNLNIPRKFKEKTELRWFSLENIIYNAYDMRSVFHKTIIKHKSYFEKLRTD